MRARGRALRKPGTPDQSIKAPPAIFVRKTTILWAPLMVVVSTAFAVEIPFFFFGTPSGHDIEFHLYSWLEVLAQWKQGIFYPRWASLAHFGYGEPRFIFYPPGSWTLGATLSAIFPWTLASNVYIWVVLAAAGISMFLLASRWIDRRDAIFAAALYTISPYHLVIVYWRSAFAELLASCLVPLLLLCVLKAIEDGWQAVVPLGIVLAAGWLTNAPAAIMLHYSMALLLVFFAWRQRAMRLIVIGAAAVALGACLSAFYLLPAIYEQRWIEISQAVSAGSRPSDNFLFVHTTDPDHDAFNHVISWVAVFEIALIAAATWLGELWSLQNSNEGRRDLGKALITWAAACAFVMFPLSALLWRILPKMQFMQFPWRWLLCMSLIFALFVAFGIRRWRWRGLICALAILVIAMGWLRIQKPWWDTAADLREMQDNMESRVGYEGTDEYTPAGADPASIDKEARNVTVAGRARAAIRVQRWDAEFKTFTADVSAPDHLALHLFAYPAWEAEVNGHVVQTSNTEIGQMLVPVETGMNRVQVRFVRTWDRTLGGWISAATVFLTCTLLVLRRRKSSLL